MIQKKKVLNYIWLHQKGAKERALAPELVSAALKTAKSNPDVQVLLWFDPRLLGKQDWKLASQEVTSNDCPITFCDLNQIADYRNNDNIFGSDVPYEPRSEDEPYATIWQRVDLLRLLAIKHCFEVNPKVEDAFYSDMDLKRGVLCWEARRKFKNHGFVVTRHKDYDIENQAFGFSREVFKDYGFRFIDETSRAYRVMPYNNGWGAFVKSVGQLVNDFGISKHKMTFLPKSVSDKPLDGDSFHFSDDPNIRAIQELLLPDRHTFSTQSNKNYGEKHTKLYVDTPTRKASTRLYPHVPRECSSYGTAAFRKNNPGLV